MISVSSFLKALSFTASFSVVSTVLFSPGILWNDSNDVHDVFFRIAVMIGKDELVYPG